MTKHTPGPWHISHETDWMMIRGRDPEMPDDSEYAFPAVAFLADRGAKDANAQLIAEAPAMLTTLWRIVALCESEYPAMDVRKLVHQAARAAIAKADGE
jgi:hypothetical protein